MSSTPISVIIKMSPDIVQCPPGSKTIMQLISTNLKDTHTYKHTEFHIIFRQETLKSNSNDIKYTKLNCKQSVNHCVYSSIIIYGIPERMVPIHYQVESPKVTDGEAKTHINWMAFLKSPIQLDGNKNSQLTFSIDMYLSCLKLSV